ANQKAFLTGTIKDNYIDVSASYSYYNRIREIYSKDLSTEEYTLSTNSGDLDTTKFYAGQFRGVWSKYRRDSILFNYQVGFDINLETGTGAKIQDREQSINDYAIFISAKHHPYKKLLLQGGVRFAYNTEYNPPITPSINIKYDIFDNLMVRSSYSRGFRAPALKQLYLDFNHFVDIRGNANLKAEQSNNFQLNIKYSVKNDNSVFSIEPDLFFNDIDNKIDLLQQTEITIVNSIPDTNVFYIYKNFDNYKTRGYRIKFSYKRGNKLSINLGIANIGSKSVIDKTIIDNTNYVYSPEIGVAAKYFFTDIETNLQLNYKYTGEHERYWVDFDNNLLKNREEDYHMLDISVNRNFLADRFSVVAGVKNAFNVNDINIIGDNGGAYRGYGSSRSVAYGRTYFFRLTYHFNR
ncbi:MAG: TonB-dependent receptor, partial [Bacteroidota bacterium]|nr:TonB-dependent receptor [Bacteroidota bacterium]